MNRRRFALTLTALLGRKGLQAWQQGPLTIPDRPAPERSSTPVIRVDVDLVNVLFTVRRRHGDQLVSNLTQDDFTVLEDGRPQTISRFSRETDLPLTLGLLVYVSLSQINLIKTERDAASAFFANVIRPKDEAFLLAFGRDTVLLQDFTNSVPKLQAALQTLQGDGPTSIRQNPGGGGGGNGGQYPGGGGGRYPGGGGRYPGGGGPFPPMGGPRGRRGGPGGGGGGRYPSRNNGKGTLMFDAVELSSTEEINQKSGRKALVLITDGEDRGSYYSRDQAIEAAQRADGIIYSIYYVDPGMYRGRGGDAMHGPGDLKTMSEETGGRMFTVGHGHTLQNIFDELQAEMRSQYSIAYKPASGERNGEYRQVEIKTKSGDYEVQARKGYYAAKPKAT